VCVVKKKIDKGYTNIFLRIIFSSARVLESNFEFLKEVGRRLRLELDVKSPTTPCFVLKFD
jgi:hypothetical protein